MVMVVGEVRAIEVAVVVRILEMMVDVAGMAVGRVKW